MTKRKFENFIEENLKNLPLEKQEELLDKISNKWIPDIEDKFHKKIEKGYKKCSKCNKYFLKTKYTKTWETETYKDELVYSDAGYGDDDEYADVTYNIEYLICPSCGAKNENKKMYLHMKNRHKRWERVCRK